jgi:hypothetical protein
VGRYFKCLTPVVIRAVMTTSTAKTTTTIQRPVSFLSAGTLDTVSNKPPCRNRVNNVCGEAQPRDAQKRGERVWMEVAAFAPWLRVFAFGNVPMI